MNEETSSGEASWSRALVELGECELPTRPNSPAVCRARRQSWAQKSSQLRKINVVSYGVVHKRPMPSPELHARKMRNEKGGLGNNTYPTQSSPHFLFFAFIIFRGSRAESILSLIRSASVCSVHVDVYTGSVM